jgi:hypothetical protein
MSDWLGPKWQQELIKRFLSFAVSRGITEWDQDKLTNLLDEVIIADQAAESKKRLGFKRLRSGPRMLGWFLVRLKRLYQQYEQDQERRLVSPNRIVQNWEGAHGVFSVFLTTSLVLDAIVPTLQQFLDSNLGRHVVKILEAKRLDGGWYDMRVVYQVGRQAEIFDQLRRVPWLLRVRTKPATDFGRVGVQDPA